MKTLASLSHVVAVALAFSVALTGCQKKRDAKLPYGADRDLLTISNYEGQDYDLFTKGLLKKASTGAQVNIKDDRKDNKTKVKNFDYVEYDSKDPLKLTDNTLMLGRPNFQYKVRYVFEGNLLKVMKVSKPEDLATDELASASDAGQGFKMVPIVSYNVSYFSLDRARNELNEKTSQIELITQQGRSSSTHFKVDLNSKTRASLLSKSTVLPANFFTAEGDTDWYFAVTVTSLNYKEGGGNLGNHLSFDKYGREATKVRARKVEDKIIFYNLGVDDRLEKSLEQRSENQAAALTIEADFIDYRMSENGKTTSVKEESHKEKAWDKREYVELKLKNTKVPYVDFQISEIKDIQIDDGYFSFLAYSETIGGLARFSLLSKKAYDQKMLADGAKPYQRKIYFRDDQNLFGFFSTKIESLSSFDRSKYEQAEKLEFINRFNPTRKEIEYRLNHDAPKWLEGVATSAAAGWNATFKAAGLQTRIRITDDKGQVLRGAPGDLRYSLINMYYDVDSSGNWGGFGPKLSDPHTGEIVMATANMNITNIVEGVERLLNNYLLSLKGDLETRYVLGLPIPSLQAVSDNTSRTLEIMGSKWLGLKNKSISIFNAETKNFSNELSINKYDPQTRSFIKNVKVTAKDENKPVRATFSNQHLLENRFELVNGNIADQVQTLCSDLHLYGTSLSDGKGQSELEKEVALIKKCAIEISKPILINITLHEMGHNLGLRHNFYGSTDKNNFYAPVEIKLGNKSIKTQWTSTTVMDYLSMNYENIIQPGLYDTAAIRWGYLDALEDSKGQIVRVNSNKSTRKQIQNNYRFYKYCTDEHVDVAVQDPMCARQDAGTSPVEVVSNLIKTYDASMATWNHRHNRDRIGSMGDLAWTRVENFVLPMRRFYEKWRVILASQAGPGNEYLEAFSTPEAYQSLIKKALNPEVVGAKNAELHAQYKHAADMIFDFLMRVAFLPDYSCMTERDINGEKTIQMFPFSKIQKNIFTTSGKTVTSCQDSVVKDYLQRTKNASVFAEAGYPFDNIYGDLARVEVSLQNYQIVDRPEVVGIAQDRSLAMQILTVRMAELYGTGRIYNFAPNFMDELPYREALTQKVIERLTEGVPVQETGLDKALGQELPALMSPSFETEKPLLGLMFQSLLIGQIIPNKSVVTNERLEKFAIVPFYMLDGSDNPECAMINGYRWCATDQHPVAKGLITKLNSLQKMKASFTIDDKVVEQFLEMAIDLIPKQGEFDQFDLSIYFTLLERVEKIEKTNPILAQNFYVLLSVLGPEMNIWQQGVSKQMQKIQEEDLSKKEQEEKFIGLTKIKLKTLVEKIGATNYKELNDEIFKNRVNAFVADLKQNALTYQADPTELDAQADILLEVLMLGGRAF